MGFTRLIDYFDKWVREDLGDYYIVTKDRLKNIESCMENLKSENEELRAENTGLKAENRAMKEQKMKGAGLIMKYFVLKPVGESAYARASRIAMLAYADAINEVNPELSEDLKQWVSSCERKE